MGSLSPNQDKAYVGGEARQIQEARAGERSRDRCDTHFVRRGAMEGERKGGMRRPECELGGPV